MARVVFEVSRLLFEHLIHLFKFAGHRWDFGGRSMTGPMSKPSERQLVGRPATLMINAEGISARKGAGGAVVDEKWKGNPKPGHQETIFTGRFEIGKIGLEDMLVRGRGKAVVRARSKGTVKDFPGGLGLDEAKGER